MYLTLSLFIVWLPGDSRCFTSVFRGKKKNKTTHHFFFLCLAFYLLKQPTKCCFTSSCSRSQLCCCFQMLTVLWKSHPGSKFMQRFVAIRYFNTQDLKPQSGSQEATSQQLGLSDRGLRRQNLAVASLLRRPGCTCTKASSFFQARVLSMN